MDHDTADASTSTSTPVMGGAQAHVAQEATGSLAALVSQAARLAVSAESSPEERLRQKAAAQQLLAQLRSKLTTSSSISHGSDGGTRLQNADSACSLRGPQASYDSEEGGLDWGMYEEASALAPDTEPGSSVHSGAGGTGGTESPEDPDFPTSPCATERSSNVARLHARAAAMLASYLATPSIASGGRLGQAPPKAPQQLPPVDDSSARSRPEASKSMGRSSEGLEPSSSGRGLGEDPPTNHGQRHTRMTKSEARKAVDLKQLALMERAAAVVASSRLAQQALSVFFNPHAPFQNSHMACDIGGEGRVGIPPGMNGMSDVGGTSGVSSISGVGGVVGVVGMVDMEPMSYASSSAASHNCSSTGGAPAAAAAAAAPSYYDDSAAAAAAAAASPSYYGAAAAAVAAAAAAAAAAPLGGMGQLTASSSASSLYDSNGITPMPPEGAETAGQSPLCSRSVHAPPMLSISSPTPSVGEPSPTYCMYGSGVSGTNHQYRSTGGGTSSTNLQYGSMGIGPGSTNLQYGSTGGGTGSTNLQYVTGSTRQYRSTMSPSTTHHAASFSNSANLQYRSTEGGTMPTSTMHHGASFSNVTNQQYRSTGGGTMPPTPMYHSASFSSGTNLQYGNVYPGNDTSSTNLQYGSMGGGTMQLSTQHSASPSFSSMHHTQQRQNGIAAPLPTSLLIAQVEALRLQLLKKKFSPPISPSEPGPRPPPGPSRLGVVPPADSASATSRGGSPKPGEESAASPTHVHANSSIAAVLSRMGGADPHQQMLEEISKRTPPLRRTASGTEWSSMLI